MSSRQLTFVGFESPFSRHLPANNRWVQLASQIPWDDIVGIYERQLNNSSTGASHINPRVAIGALMVKHLLNASDRDTILAIQENIYIQYFLGFDSIVYDEPFNASLFVEIRKRMGMENIEKVNDLIYAASMRQMPKGSTETPDEPVGPDDESGSGGITSGTGTTACEDVEESTEVSHSGQLLIDATACPQDIAFPTDLKLLNASREKSETLIDKLYRPFVHGRKKPRTYRVEARDRYLDLAKKKVRKRSEIRKAIGQQLRYLRRNLKTIQSLMSVEGCRELGKRDKRYLETIMKVYEQQLSMYENGTHRVAERIVSIHQPHVRPIVRGKEKAKVEFGSKINVSLVDGYSFLDHLSWDAFNEGSYLMDSVEKYRKRHGFYPSEVLVDSIYCTRENHRKLKELGIKLTGRQLGRPPKAG